MSENIEYLVTTMDADKLQKIENINSFANNFSCEFKSFLSDRGIGAKIKEFTNKKHNELHIQLILDTAYSSAVDMIPVLIRKLASFYDFDWGFVDDMNMELVSSASSQNKIINIDILNIKNKTQQ